MLSTSLCTTQQLTYLQADPLIPAKGSTQYYDSVTAVIPDVHNSYRHFEVPGLGHCFGGQGGHPSTTFNALRDWVEKGVVPETLPISFSDKKGVLNKRILCPYPKKQKYDGFGDPTSEKSFICASWLEKTLEGFQQWELWVKVTSILEFCIYSLF